MSIAVRVGVVVGVVLLVVLTLMFTVLRYTQESAMMHRAEVQADQVQRLISGSVTSAMAQGVTEIAPLLANASAVQGVTDLRAIPTAAIHPEAHKQMDDEERGVVGSKTGVTHEEIFQGEPVLRTVVPMIADDGCTACHDVRSGDVLAVLSIRYSMAEHHAAIAGERWLIIGMALPTIGLTFLGVMVMTRRTIVTPLGEGVKTLAVLATGDLTARMHGDDRGDIGVIRDSINRVGASLQEALQEVRAAVVAAAGAATEISTMTEEMAAGAQEQTGQATEVAGAVEQVTRTILESAKGAELAAETAQRAGTTAQQGGRVVDDTVDGMRRIAAVVNRSAETVRELGRSSDQIGEIIGVIDEIADQTNLLALNAAIEAARAGDQGRGFAVVADEVRKLAERTTRATKEIAGMIRKIQTDTAGAVTSMEEGTREVERGIALADRAGASLREIVDVSQNVTGMVARIAAAGGEQSEASEQISRNVEGISKVTEETAAGTQQIAKAADDLSRLTVNLQTLIGRFILDGTRGAGPRTPDRSDVPVRENGHLDGHRSVPGSGAPATHSMSMMQ